VQFTDEEARQMVEEFANGDAPLEVVDRQAHAVQASGA
jgi:hypothetical protein